MRQREFSGELSCRLKLDCGEAGVTAYMCEEEHYEAALRRCEDVTEAVLKLNIGGIKHVQTVVPVAGNEAVLKIKMDNYNYNFFVESDGSEVYLGSGQGKYLTSEVSGGFTGVLLGLYATGENNAEFSNFICDYFCK